MHYLLWIGGSALGLILGATLGGVVGYDMGLLVGHRLANKLSRDATAKQSAEMVDVPPADE